MRLAEAMTQRYHPVLVVFHWLLAAMVLFSLVMGMASLVNIPNASPQKLFALRGHMLAGVAMLVLTLARLFMRLRLGVPAPVPSGSTLLDRLAPAVHYGLYAGVILMAASGVALALQAGLPDTVFRGTGVLPESFAAYAPRIAHGILAWMVSVLVALHVGAALYHQLVRRDGIFSRMALR